MVKKVLITGAAGNIGSALVHKLLDDGNYFVIAVDDLSTGDRKKIENENIKDNFRFIKADANDFTEMSSIFLAFKFDFVFHFAAVVGVKRTLENPIKVLNDIEGIRNILSLSKNTGVSKVFYSSSSEVYGEPVFLPQNEDTTPLNSKLPYAIVKNVGEAYFRSYFNEYGLNYSIFRFFNTYGPKQSKDFVVSKFISSAINNEDITIYGDGNQTRTFCYIDDNIDTIMEILKSNTFNNETLNIGSDEEMTVNELALLIIKITNSSSKIVNLPALPEGDMTRRQPDIGKMKTVLKRDLIPIAKGIELFLEKSKWL
jgi:UDP-glucuronate decarboxylase